MICPICNANNLDNIRNCKKCDFEFIYFLSKPSNEEMQLYNLKVENFKLKQEINFIKNNPRIKEIEKVIYKDRIVEKIVHKEKIVYKDKIIDKPILKHNSEHSKIENELTWEDKETNLMWQNEISTSRIDWQEAVEYAEILNKKKYAGYSDWKLPSLNELKTILERDAYKSMGRSTYIKRELFSYSIQEFQTTWTLSEGVTSNTACVVNFRNGRCYDWNERKEKHFVRCVRYV